MTLGEEPELRPDVADSTAAGDTGRRSVARNTKSLLISQGATWSLALVLTTVVPRFINPEEFGRMRLAGSLWSIVSTLVTFGTISVITVGFARGTEDESTLRSAVSLQTVMFGFGAVIVLAYARWQHYSGELLLLVVLAGGTPLLYSFGETARAAFYGLERMALPARIDIGLKVITVAATLGVLLLGGRAVAISALAIGLGLLYAAAMIVALRSDSQLTIRPTTRGLRRVARKGLPFLMVEAGVVIYRQSDTIALSRLANETQVGLYSVAETFLGSMLVVPTILLTAVFPALARLSAERPDDALEMVRKGLRLIFVATVPLGLGILVISRQIAPILFGNDFRRSGPVLGAMGVVMIVMVPSILIANYAITIGRQSRWGFMNLAGIAASIPLYIWWIPWAEHRFSNGALGAALVFVATEAVILVAAVVLIAPAILTRSLLSGCAKAVTAGLIMVGAAWPVRDRFLLIPVAVGAVTYVAAIAIMRTVPPDELDVVRRRLKRRTREDGGARR